MSVGTEKIRNIAIAGHGGTGKTSFTEHLLFAGATIGKAETVESGRTVSDFIDEEIHQRISIRTSFSSIIWNDCKINVLDAPGSSDFVGEVITAFRAAETAVLVIGAKAGVQIETIKLWRGLERLQKPVIVFVNKMDEERADFSSILSDLKDRFKKNFVPIVFPMGQAADFRGVVSVLDRRAYAVPSAGEKERPADVEGGYPVLDEYAQRLVEAAAEGDDELMTAFFEKGTLSPEDVGRGLRAAIKDGKVVPVLCGSATKHSGMKAFLDFVAAEAPSPLGFPEKTVQDEVFGIRPDGPLAAFCFKTSIDQFSGQLSFVKVLGGKLSPDSEIVNQREGKKERLAKIYIPQGRKLVDTAEIPAGDIGVLAKLAHTHTNDSLCAPELAVRFKALDLPQPVFSLAVSAKAKKDEDKMSQMLQRAAEEDKTFTIRFNSETKETVISGMGELHLNMILNKIRDTQKIELETAIPRVAYRETIARASEAVYRHKKQSGGHGQFAEVAIQIKPLPRGQHYAFENIIKGMAVSKGYIPGIEKGLHEAMEAGVFAGYPVMDVAIALTDGKEHPVDSSEMAFKIASREALKAAMEKAGPVLLEPIMNLSVFIEEQYLGDVLSDMSSRRGRVLGQDQLGGGICEVKAQVPQAELLRYAIDLKALTSGTGGFEVAFDHYSPVTGKVAEDVKQLALAARASE